MSNIYENNRKFVTTKQRWETLTQNITKKIINKENSSISQKHAIVKSIQKNKSTLSYNKKIELPQRTITKYFKTQRSQIYSNLKLQDSKGCIREFRCYDDKALNIPNSFSQTITHSLDNDCQSDDEQVQLAVEQLKNLLESQINQLHKSF
ncbi:unnamed protein product (macronuclear) [Paramecium tetraurelia]|uniref:Uncharacterized protein n=1 Tax=Paramecium tetraurelia TaxID=5888 RepID=A0E6H3_PARTE|nr:uncharacterized protein GSPATT00003755001 [Paramecium tetraurelia]CAK90890.1 unnamed protein product [Paramecium tetraurelia]|eukprot:XP_001458287.1 hypothetical protein (macronuclear) [Paramecium tetraurelia strain d4-2]